MTEVEKTAKLLLTYMTGLREYRWQESDNEELVLKDDELPVWTATTACLRELLKLVQERK